MYDLVGMEMFSQRAPPFSTSLILAAISAMLAVRRITSLERLEGTGADSSIMNFQLI